MNAPSTTINLNPFTAFYNPVLDINRQKTSTPPQERILYTNEAIIHGLKIRDKRVISFIYKKSYAQVKYYVTSNSGDTMDAEDVFQDALVFLYKQIDADEFRLTCSFNTYLYSICKHLWLQKLNKYLRYTDIQESIALTDPYEEEERYKDHLVESEKYRLFEKHFNRLNEKEQKILKLYTSKTRGKEIAKIMGFKSDKYVKFRKYVVKEKLKNMIANDEHFQNIYQMGN